MIAEAPSASALTTSVPRRTPSSRITRGGTIDLRRYGSQRLDGRRKRVDDTRSVVGDNNAVNTNLSRLLSIVQIKNPT